MSERGKVSMIATIESVARSWNAISTWLCRQWPKGAALPYGCRSAPIQNRHYLSRSRFNARKSTKNRDPVSFVVMVH